MHTKRWYQDWLGWLIVGSIAYGLLCLIGLASDVGRPFPGFLSYHDVSEARIEMEYNVPAGWWDTTGKRPFISDRLLQVEETSFNNLPAPIPEAPLYQKAWDTGKTTVTIHVGRDGQPVTLAIPLELFSWAHYGELMLMPVIVAACFWLLAIILYRASSREKTERLVILVLCAIAIIGVAIRPSLFGFGNEWQNILTYINLLHTIAVTFIGALFIHLALLFPFPRWPRLTRWLMAIVYSTAAGLYICFLLSKIMVWQSGNSFLAGWLNDVWYTNFLYLIVIGVGCFLVRLLGEAVFLQSRTRQRQEARLMLLAFCLFLPLVWFSVHDVSGSKTTIYFLQSLIDTRYFSLAVPFAFAAISLRYHTFAGAERWLFLALVLAVSGFLANAVTAVLFWQRSPLIRDLPFPPTAVLFLLFLGLSLVWGWQSGWRGWLGRVFQWERVSYHEVLTYGNRLAATAYTDERQLAQGMADALCEALGVVHAAVWLPEPADLTLTAVSGNIPETVVPRLKQPAVFPTRPIRLEQVIAEWLQPCYPDMAVILPLTISGRAAGLIGLGQRWDTAVFDDRDLEILDLIAQQSAIFLQNTQQTAQLRQTDQQLLHIQELTRQKTAQNLHDHLLPALSQLQMKLLTANQLISTQPDKAHTLLAESQKGLRENAELVRRIQKDLVIRPLEYGLSPYLQELVNQFNQDTGIATDLQLPAALDTIITDRNTREAIYAVWQQGLDNIAQHAQATQVTANMTVDADEIAFSICDNGRGSPPEEQEKARQNGRFGLRSMQIRLETIGGQFAFHSTPNQGSCIQAQIPLISVQNSANLHSR